MSTSILAQPPGCVNPSAHLKPAVREIYRALCNLCRREGYAWISNETLAYDYDASVSTVERWISRLRTLGLIRTEYCHKTHRRHIFCLVPLASLRREKKGVPRKTDGQEDGEYPAIPPGLSHAGDDSDNSPKKHTPPAAPAVYVPLEAATTPAAPVVAPSACVCTPPVPPATLPVASPEIVNATEQLVAAGLHPKAAQRLAQLNAQECLEQVQACRAYPNARNLPGLLVAAITGQYRRKASPAPSPAPVRRPAPLPPPPDPAAPAAALSMVASMRARLGPRRA